MSSPPPTSPTLPTTNASDLAAAAALSNLTSHSADPDSEASKSSNAADTAALGAAASNLSLSDKSPTKDGVAKGVAVAEVKKAIKIDQGDVVFLVSARVGQYPFSSTTGG